MNLADFMVGLEILKPYYDDLVGCQLGAEHDQIYLYPTDRSLSEEDQLSLLELGFFQPDSDDDSDDGAYVPTEGWSCFV